MKHAELLKAVEVAKRLLDGSQPIDFPGACMVLNHALVTLTWKDNLSKWCDLQRKTAKEQKEMKRFLIGRDLQWWIALGWEKAFSMAFPTKAGAA